MVLPYPEASITSREPVFQFDILLPLQRITVTYINENNESAILREKEGVLRKIIKAVLFIHSHQPEASKELFDILLKYGEKRRHSERQGN